MSQYECLHCFNRKFFLETRKGNNICECGKMMRKYIKKDFRLSIFFNDNPFVTELRCIPEYEMEIEDGNQNI